MAHNITTFKKERKILEAESSAEIRLGEDERYMYLGIFQHLLSVSIVSYIQ